jgi:hypothetical protein
LNPVKINISKKLPDDRTFAPAADQDVFFRHLSRPAQNVSGNLSRHIPAAAFRRPSFSTRFFASIFIVSRPVQRRRMPHFSKNRPL